MDLLGLSPGCPQGWAQGLILLVVPVVLGFTKPRLTRFMARALGLCTNSLVLLLLFGLSVWAKAGSVQGLT